jgi:hypothetical protein
MLSYLKYQNAENEENLAETGNTQSEKPKQSVLSSSDKSAKRSTYFLCLLFIIGIGLLFYMINESSPQKAQADGVAVVDAEQARIEAAITRFTGAKSKMSEGIDTVVDKFNKLESVEQVGIEYLKKNPFSTDNSEQENVNSLDYTGFDSEILRKQRIKQQAQSLRLQSIIQAGAESKPSCIINDKVYFLGDKVMGFEIKEIRSEHIAIEQAGVKIVLKLKTEY